MSADDDKNIRSGDRPTKGPEPGDHTVIVETPRVLGCYRLTRLLGRGGMGEVWQAFDTQLERDVAIKLMRRELLSNEDATRRFAREARAVARLNHPNIVQVYTFGDEDGITYFVMEMVEGETVSQGLKRRGTLPLAECLHIVMQAIEGLSYANARGIIHRDIKPSNLMLTGDARVKIADFGLAKMVEHDTQMTAAGTAMGSPNYMSPEQARGEEADHRSDIYALGISFYQMLCGQLPFTAKSPVSVLLKHIQEPLPEPKTIKKLGNGNVMSILKKMTDKKSSARYQSYEELAADLDALQPEVNFRGAHHATASMRAPESSPPPPPPVVKDEEADSIFSPPSESIVATPSDNKTAIVSSRDSAADVEYDEKTPEKNRIWIPIVAGGLLLALLIPIIWFMMNRNDSDGNTNIASEVTSSSSAAGNSNDIVATPLPSPVSSTQTNTVSSRQNSMKPVDVSVLLTPQPTLMPGIPEKITPTPNVANMMPSSGQVVIGAADDQVGASLPLYDSSGNMVDFAAVGATAAIIRPATLRGQKWYVIRHNDGEAFIPADNVHENTNSTEPPSSAQQTNAVPHRKTYLLGTAGAGLNEQVPTFYDGNGKRAYKSFSAGTEVKLINATTTMLRVVAPDGKVVYVYKRMASLKQ